MNLQEESRSRASREILKELLNDGKGHLASELKRYLEQRAKEEKIGEITPGIFSRACQDVVSKENGKYIRDDNGYYRLVKDYKEQSEDTINDGVSKIIDDTIRRVIKEVAKKNPLDYTPQDLEGIKKAKTIVDFLRQVK